ncbi:unnamed protein product [Coccothraustes coccothraustes]
MPGRGETRPGHAGDGAGPGRADRQHPPRAAATRKRKEPHANRPRSIPGKAPPRGGRTHRIRERAGLIDPRWIDRSLLQCSRSRSVPPLGKRSRLRVAGWDESPGISALIGCGR